MRDVKVNEQTIWDNRPISRDAFIALVRERGIKLYRDLPWRNVDDPYAVLVSEVMLQQTQVARVLNYWPKWMDMFPSVDALAAADTASVLEAWQGLGYNRRALALKRACEECSAGRGGELPHTVEELVAFPGIGPATAAGIVAFAYNEPSVYIETNVRSVFLHEVFPDKEDVSDKEIAPYVIDVCPKDDARAWYYALLDYGAHLKSQVVNPSRRSKHYTRQSAFEGSRRQKRSFILKHVIAEPEGIRRETLYGAFKDADIEIDPELFDSIVSELINEGFFHGNDDILFC